MEMKSIIASSHADPSLILTSSDLIEISSRLGIRAIGAVSVDEYCRIYDMMSSGRSDRKDIASLLPTARSLVVFGVPYLACSFDEFRGAATESSGFVTPMANEYEYHGELRAIGERLAAAIAEAISCDLESFDHAVAVDTNSLSDRIAALSAGIGKFGRNGFVISDVLGTSFNIGTLITSIEVENTADFRSFKAGDEVCSHCGSCSRCETSCPTGAIGSFESRGEAGAFDMSLNIDRGRCISAISQKKGELTPFEESVIGEYRSIYGCDECQTSCPRNIAPQRELRESLGNGETGRFTCIVDVDEMASLTKRQFNERYRHTGFVWRGFKTLVRNAEIIRSRK
jgi:epoxyqueuosine reductase